jgi:hypothetical protein
MPAGCWDWDCRRKILKYVCRKALSLVEASHTFICYSENGHGISVYDHRNTFSN